MKSNSHNACNSAGISRRAMFSAAVFLSFMSSVPVAIAAPAAGDVYVYRVINGYNRETVGKVEHRIDKIDGDRVAETVTTDVPALGLSHTDVFNKEGNWMRHPLTNHDQPVEYEFPQPYPAYVYPLDKGKSWSLRINAINTATGRRNSVRVDGEVLGAERITSPAGAFDTVKVKRRVYAGDFAGAKSETNITEADWFAPALGRPVRKETNSGYMDQQRCSDEMSACTQVRGAWLVLELVEVRPGGR